MGKYFTINRGRQYGKTTTLRAPASYLKDKYLVVSLDYLGQIFIVECKIWHGQKYNEEGERQLLEYMERYHLKKGYMLTFSFNKQKTPGMKTRMIEDKILVEALV